MTFKQLRPLVALCAAVLLVGCGSSDSSSSGSETQAAKPPSSPRPATAGEGTEGSEHKQGTPPPTRHKNEAGKQARSQKGAPGDRADGSPDSTASQPPEDERSAERRRKEARERKEAENQPPPRPKPGEEPQPEYVPKPKETDSQ